MESDFGVVGGRSLNPATTTRATDSDGKLNSTLSGLDADLRGLAELVSSLEDRLSPFLTASEPSDEAKYGNLGDDNSSILVKSLREQRRTVQEIRAKVLSIYERTEI